MKSYNQKQQESNLNRGDYVKPKLRQRLINQIYYGRYAEYCTDMNRYAIISGSRRERPFQVREIAHNRSYDTGVKIQTHEGHNWIYPYFLVDKYETYNPEEDI